MRWVLYSAKKFLFKKVHLASFTVFWNSYYNYNFSQNWIFNCEFMIYYLSNKISPYCDNLYFHYVMFIFFLLASKIFTVITKILY